MTSSLLSKPASASDSAQEAPVIYAAPYMWQTDNRKRHFTRLPDRHFSRASDVDTLRRSVVLFLKQQDERGSFYSDQDYRGYDKIDDQLGACAALAYILAEDGPDAKIIAALERGVRFQLDHLVWPVPGSRSMRYSRGVLDYDAPSGDWCNNNWCLWGGALTYLHGARFLAPKTAGELRALLVDYWTYVSTFPTRDEGPCHNQFLAYCDIGVLCGQVIGDKKIVQEAVDHYHQRVRKLRIHDRGHWIYTEFNQWDANYGVLSWMALEHLFAATGDPAFEEDAEQMALYFNELVSAGGYIWGGSRREEGGIDEFIHAPVRWAEELGLERLLLPEPSHLWRRLAMDGHYAKVLVHRTDAPLVPRKNKRKLPPTPWHFRTGEASVCLSDDTKLHHASSAGLEIIPAINSLGTGSGLVWEKDGAWKYDLLQVRPPKASQGHRYTDSGPIHLGPISGVASMQRGYVWETRQWWLSSGSSLIWIGQVTTHASPACDRTHFILGNPILTRLAGEPVPVTEVESSEGTKADTQGDAITLASPQFLRFGDVCIGGTAPVSFVRPARDAFHTFPAPGGRHSRESTSSNDLRVLLSETPTQYDCRVSLFFAVELGREKPSLIAQGDLTHWQLKTKLGNFEARQKDGIWSYDLDTGAGPETLPYVGFGFHPSAIS
jgi:hypothetical protein